MGKVYVSEITDELAVVQHMGGYYFFVFHCPVNQIIRTLKTQLAPEYWGWKYLSRL